MMARDSLCPPAPTTRCRHTGFPSIASVLNAVLILVVLALFASAALSPLPAVATPVHTITLGAEVQSQHYIVQARHESVASSTLDKAERAWSQLAPHFGRLPKKPITIVVVEDSAEYEQIQPAPMTRGFATFGGRQIYLLGAQLDQEVVTHELAHILLGLNVRDGLDIPDWFNEGLAQYASGAQRPSLEFIYAATSGGFVPLPALDSIDALQGPNRDLATVEGLAVVGFLADTYGEPDLWRLVAHLATARSFGQALIDTYGRTDQEISRQWMAYARNNYSLFSASGLRFIGGFAFIVLALVAATLWFIRRSVLLARKVGEPSLTQTEVNAARALEDEWKSTHGSGGPAAFPAEDRRTIDTPPPPP